MATKSYQYQNQGRRACTEMPDNCDAIDINNIPEGHDNNANQIPVGDDVDDIDFKNYKGIYANDDSGQKYQCPETGAHFEYNDLCKRMIKIQEKRKQDDEKIYGKSSQSQQQIHQVYASGVQPQINNIVGGQATNEIFSSSIMSEKLDYNHSHNMQPGNQKMLQFKNKFEELSQQQNRMSSSGAPTQLKSSDNINGGNSRNNKENCYSFLQQKSMKDLTGSTAQPIIHSTQHNKRQSHDRPKATGQNMNAIDTYNKLMQIMNDKVLKNVNSAITGSRGKSGEKSTKTISQPAIMNQSSSNKKIKTFATNQSIIPQTSKIQASQNSHSREKTNQHQSITTVLKSQPKIVSAGSSRNNNGIQGQMNTQAATKQFLSFYQNMNNQSTTNKRHDLLQNNSASINVLQDPNSYQLIRDSSNKKLSSQKSTGSINQKGNIQKSQQIDSQATINELMTKYMKQQQSQGIAVSGTVVSNDKSRNSNIIMSSKTQTESMIKNGPGNSTTKQASRPITANAYNNQVQVPTSQVLQSKILVSQPNQNKRKSGSGIEYQQSRNSGQYMHTHQTVQNIATNVENNDYLRRVEYQNASNEGYTSTALQDLQKKIESKNKSRSGTAGVGVSHNSYHMKQQQHLSSSGTGNAFGQQQRSQNNINNYFSGNNNGRQ
ncbi:UNKNOWN [Stylonychia lemnae]|uniref:Uncharacterized protein n=1 Tax=Stylonychia lemnae TaxID=5949 RepID=A0A078A830_STYLE|nr:UNKNOWN [Stylonychia lemnae]|eukprot:CDW78410.1 UNKNOWN [Stylonychia lemnae]